MKEETLKKITQLSELVQTDDVAKFRTQADATVELAKRCDIHPLFHSFLELYILRTSIVAATGNPPGPLYSGGQSSKFIMDSVFDEVIDEVVEGLGQGCLCKGV
jgi:hypothetical protein